MDPFTIPFSGGASWVELLLAIGSGIVMLIYLYQVIWPRINAVFLPKPDYEERVAELLRVYRKQKAEEGASESQ